MQNLKKIREEKNISQKELSKLSGLSSGHIGDIERGATRLTKNTIEKLSQALGVSPDELIKNTNEAVVSSKISLKLFTHKLSAGQGVEPIYSLNKEYSIMEIDKDFLELITKRNVNNLIMFTIQGDSMSPDVESGETVIIDSSINFFNNDGLYAFIYNKEFYFKRVQRTPDKILLISNNKTYQTIEIPIPPKYEFQVIGEVLGTFFKKLH
ncbi:MAG: LexA family transcriptional regulator [Alphaproteobacteria bacterium]|nr:LexA family transcriptional regulator [Alphaproteobacteria bacterium]